MRRQGAHMQPKRIILVPPAEYTVRGGATRLTGATLAMSAAVGASSGFAAAFGRDFSIAA